MSIQIICDTCGARGPKSTPGADGEYADLLSEAAVAGWRTRSDGTVLKDLCKVCA